MRRKTFTLLYGKVTQDNPQRVLSESAGLCEIYGKSILVCFYRLTVYPAKKFVKHRNKINHDNASQSR